MLQFLQNPFRQSAESLARKVTLSGPGKGYPTLLCMNRAVLSSDIKAMGSRTKLNFASISSPAFEALLAPHVLKELQVQTFYQKNYLQSSAELKQKLKSIVSAFLTETAKRIPFSAVISANSDYWQDEVLKDVCAEQAIPFLVLCRENYAVKYEQDLLRKRITDSGFSFRGTAVAVTSDITRETMLSTGAYGPSEVTTVGWPRFDSWLDMKPLADEDRTLITLVSYQQATYLAPRNFVTVLHEFVAAARQSGKAYQFCIKLKKAAHLQGLLMSCPQLLLSGIKIVVKQPLDDLLRRSRMVIGYNTTGVLEAYLTDAAVVVPWWDDAVRSGDNCLVAADVESDRRTTYFPSSPADLRMLIVKALDKELPSLGSPEDRLRQFQRFVWFDRAQSSSSRFEAFVRQHLPADLPLEVPFAD